MLNFYFFFSKVHHKAKTVLSRHWSPVTVTCPARIRWIFGGSVIGGFCKQLYKGVSLVKALAADFGSSSPKELRWMCAKDWSLREWQCCMLSPVQYLNPKPKARWRSLSGVCKGNDPSASLWVNSWDLTHTSLCIAESRVTKSTEAEKMACSPSVLHWLSVEGIFIRCCWKFEKARKCFYCHFRLLRFEAFSSYLAYLAIFLAIVTNCVSRSFQRCLC